MGASSIGSRFAQLLKVWQHNESYTHYNKNDFIDSNTVC